MVREDSQKKQNQILAFIQEHLQSHGYPPTVREIGTAVGFSSSATVHSYLEKLEATGSIRRDPTKPRAIEILQPNEPQWREMKMTPVPLIGQVTAGQPILAQENIEETYPLPAALLGNKDNVFMLAVAGSSMINAGIHDGDYALVQKIETADNGDIVVALLNGEEATIKRFFRENDYIRLQPENNAMEPIYSRNITILGKVIGIFRRL